MKTQREKETRICPSCGAKYSEPPALSRKDNRTLICPECGVREALQAAGIIESEQERIIEEMRKANEK